MRPCARGATSVASHTSPMPPGAKGAHDLVGVQPGAGTEGHTSARAGWIIRRGQLGPERHDSGAETCENFRCSVACAHSR